MLEKQGRNHGPHYMDMVVLSSQQELTYNSSVWTQDVVCKICREQWMIGTDEERERERERGGGEGERESWKSVLKVWLEDDDQ